MASGGEEGDGDGNEGWKELLQAAEELVKRHMDQYDPSHDWAHVQRVRSTALRLAATLVHKVDLHVVELSALFHDLSDAKYTNTPLKSTLDPLFDRHHEVLRPEQIALIYAIIPSISWSTEKTLRAAGQWTEWHDTCPELAVVQDADRLDAIGAVGVMRCAAYSAVKGRELLSESSDGSGENRGDEDSAEGHFYDKLLKIKDRMKTAAGKAEAERRHETVIAFLKAVDAEREFTGLA